MGPRLLDLDLLIYMCGIQPDRFHSKISPGYRLGRAQIHTDMLNLGKLSMTVLLFLSFTRTTMT